MTGAHLNDGFVLFGASGDLALRMLFPSLAFLEADQLLPAEIPIIGAGRSPLADDDFRRLVREALQTRAPQAVACGAADRLLARTTYLELDAACAEDFAGLRRTLASRGVARPLFYLSVSPSLYPAICQNLSAAGLSGGAARLAVEKPVGRDLWSARATNDQMQAAFGEDRTFRIDHYLGKETVQNLIALRFANTLFEPLWNSLSIDHVQITVAETEGVGERWPYYDEYGAMGDMVQNHLLQLLCLVAMEPPADMEPDSVRNEKVKVLRSLRPIGRAELAGHMVRGQYVEGLVGGARVKGYHEERGGNSQTETFVAIKAHVDNWRWAGVPFYLRTGKRLPRRDTEIFIQFKPVPHSIFPAEGRRDLRPNELLIRLQPDEDIVLRLMNQTPGLSPGGMRLESLPLSLSLRSAGARRRIAYERLILDALSGVSTLFVRRDEVEKAWDWVGDLNAAWRTSGQAPRAYPAGAWGPAQALSMLEREGRAWHEPAPDTPAANLRPTGAAGASSHEPAPALLAGDVSALV